jgi:hypothetical protein
VGRGQTEIDEVRLTIPRERLFYGAARLVVGGLGVRLDLSFESLDDLQLAAETVLMNELDSASADINVELLVGEASVTMAIGPLAAPVAKHESADKRGFDVHGLLRALVDTVEVVQRDGERWLKLEKSVSLRPPVGA